MTTKQKNPNHKMYKVNNVWLLLCKKTGGNCKLEQAKNMFGKCKFCGDVL
jgi:hypothetical protein